VSLRADQIVAGTALTLLALGVTGLLYRTTFGTTGVALTIPTAGSVSIPLLSSIPVVGRALFAQPLPTYVVYVTVPALAWWLTRTHGGLSLRAVGANPSAAVAAGVSPDRVRWLALVFGGALGNVWDRLFRGTVTDFLQMFFGSYEFPSFNAADSAITVGAALLLIDLWRTRHQHHTEHG